MLDSRALVQKRQDVIVHAAVAETIRAVCIGLRDTIRKPTEAALFDNYGRMCMVIDEVINEARTNCSLNSTMHVSCVIASVALFACRASWRQLTEMQFSGA